MTMHKALHPRDDVESLYQDKREGNELPALTDRYDDSKTT